MTVTERIESLRSYPQNSSDSFRQQIERARESASRMGAPPPGAPKGQQGIDRSKDLTPMPRPSIIRSMSSK